MKVSELEVNVKANPSKLLKQLKILQEGIDYIITELEDIENNGCPECGSLLISEWGFDYICEECSEVFILDNDGQYCSKF